MLPLALVSLLGWWMGLSCWSRVRSLNGDPRDVASVEARLRMMAVFVAILPLLGLLGTVSGMVDTFGIIRNEGMGDPRLLAGGIREALVSTESGLATALPLLLLHRVVDGRLRRAELHRLAREGAHD
jgi:biopolymer transport protein ExbB/TolQ